MSADDNIELDVDNGSTLEKPKDIDTGGCLILSGCGCVGFITVFVAFALLCRAFLWMVGL